MKQYLIVGAGFSGAVIAEQLSSRADCRITVIDERPHIGGNCYTEREKETGVMVHKYGPHILIPTTWRYGNTYSNFAK